MCDNGLAGERVHRFAEYVGKGGAWAEGFHAIRH